VQVFDFFIPSHLKFGIDSLNRIGSVVGSVGSKVFLVTENGMLSGKTVSHIQTLLSQQGCEAIVYDIPEKTLTANVFVDKGASLARASFCDVIVGVGGMRILSMAKAIAMLVNNQKSINDYIDGEVIKESSLPYIEIPTEIRNPFMFRNDFIITDMRSRKSCVLKALNAQPCSVIYDPAIMHINDLPEIMMTNLANAIEGYLSTDSNFVSDMMFLKAIEMLSKYLIPAVKNNTEDLISFLALSGLMTSMGLGCASMGVINAVSEVINQKLRIEKSAVASVLLPYVIEFCIPSSAEKIARIGAAMGINVESKTMLEVAVKVIEFVKNISNDLSFPTKLSDFSLKSEDLIGLADQAVAMNMMNYLPRSCSNEELYNILQSAF
jgi:alcohol dehydrogenase